MWSGQNLSPVLLLMRLAAELLGSRSLSDPHLLTFRRMPRKTDSPEQPFSTMPILPRQDHQARRAAAIFSWCSWAGSASALQRAVIKGADKHSSAQSPQQRMTHPRCHQGWRGESLQVAKSLTGLASLVRMWELRSSECLILLEEWAFPEVVFSSAPGRDDAPGPKAKLTDLWNTWAAHLKTSDHNFHSECHNKRLVRPGSLRKPAHKVIHTSRLANAPTLEALIHYTMAAIIL